MNIKNLILILFIILLTTQSINAIELSNPFGKKDYKSQEIKYQYGVLKEDAKYSRDKKLLNITPSGYMTVAEYEKQSEYKDKTTIDFDIPKIDRPSDFKYVPQPLYKIVKYNDPPGRTELQLGRRLFLKRQINAQGIVSPDYTKLVYPAIYYYTDSGSVGADLFVIPLTGDANNLNKILSANIAKRDPKPLLSTDKAIDNYAAFRTLTPVDFSSDGTKILVKEKLGTSEDGIWETRIYIYDFNTGTDYDLSVVREAISYFWQEYMKLNLIEKRWDIVPLGFDANNPESVIVQGYAYTGERPISLGTWQIDTKGNRSQAVSFEKNYIPAISANGYKIIKDGVEEYQTVINEEKNLKKEDKIKEKQQKEKDKTEIKQINEDYKYEIKRLKADMKDEYKDNKKLQTFAGSTEGTDLEEAYKKYQQEQLQKDIEKAQKQAEKQQKKIDKLEEKMQKIIDENNNMTDNQNQTSSQTNTDEKEDSQDSSYQEEIEGEE